VDKFDNINVVLYNWTREEIMDTGMDKKTKRIGVETFAFRVVIIIILEAVLLWWGNVSILVHLIVSSITLFTSSVVACVIFLPDGEMVTGQKTKRQATKPQASSRRKGRPEDRSTGRH